MLCNLAHKGPNIPCDWIIQQLVTLGKKKRPYGSKDKVISIAHLKEYEFEEIQYPEGWMYEGSLWDQCVFINSVTH